MQIELSQSEIDTITEALNDWKNDSNSLVSSLMSAVFMGGKDPSPEFARREQERNAKAEVRAKERNIKATILQAKLMQASLQSVTG